MTLRCGAGAFACQPARTCIVGTCGTRPHAEPVGSPRLADAGVSAFNFALDSWEEKTSLPKARVPARKNLEYLLRKQYVHGYIVFFNINICRNNLQDVRMLTDYAHDRLVATDYHINETPMLEPHDRFQHLHDNSTYIRPEDWRHVDELRLIGCLSTDRQTACWRAARFGAATGLVKAMR